MVCCDARRVHLTCHSTFWIALIYALAVFCAVRITYKCRLVFFQDSMATNIPFGAR